MASTAPTPAPNQTMFREKDKGKPTQEFATWMQGVGNVVTSALSNTQSSHTGSYTVVNADKGSTIVLSGTGATTPANTLTFNASSGYDANFQILVVNNDSRGWIIAPSGVTSFILWPGQVCIVFNNGSGWSVFPDRQKWRPISVTINVHPTLGNDANDGLGTGAGALRTIQHAVDTIHVNIEGANNLPLIQLADGTYNVGSGTIINNAMATCGININGNPVTPANVNIVVGAGGTGFSIQDMGQCGLQFMKIDVSAGGAVAIAIRQLAICDLNLITFFGAASSTGLSVTNHASCGFLGNMTWIGNFASGISITDSSFLNCSGFSLTANAATYTNFLVVDSQSKVNAGVAVIDGGVIGKKFTVANLSILFRNGSVFPGTTPGTADGTSVLV